MIAEQNAIITQILIDSPLKFQLIDAYSVTIDRGDRHQGNGDCLHYCLPGPPDFWVQIFLHSLATQKEAQETRHSEVVRKAFIERATILVHWHVPKTFGMSLRKFFSSTMCTFREISSSTLFVVLFDELLGNVTASKKLHAKYCVVWSVHAGTSPHSCRHVQPFATYGLKSVNGVVNYWNLSRFENLTHMHSVSSTMYVSFRVYVERTIRIRPRNLHVPLQICKRSIY